MSENKHLINNENIVNFIAGLLGGFISVTLCNPLDIARTRLNVLVPHLTSSPLPATTTPAKINTLIFHMPSKPYGRRKAGGASTQVKRTILRISH